MAFKPLMFKLCGLKLSACCTILNAWGIIQLGLLGFFFGQKCVTLFKSAVETDVHDESLNFDKATKTFEKNYDEFSQICYKACMMAACVFFISLWQFAINLSKLGSKKKVKKVELQASDYSKAIRASLSIQVQRPVGYATQPESVLKYIHPTS